VIRKNLKSSDVSWCLGSSRFQIARNEKGFQVQKIISKKLAVRKSRIEKRLDKNGIGSLFDQGPVLRPGDIHYEISERVQGSGCGGIGAVQLLVKRLGLAEAIDQYVHVLKKHRPYHESDHVLNIAYNALLDGTCLQDIELRRNDENFLDALNVLRIPDPTTAGDFCRRFTHSHISTLQNAINGVRIRAWKKQPRAFFGCATIDLDGTVVGTTGECKHGMDIAYNGIWGYHPLVVSLANTREVLSIVNRPGNRPSHEGAAAEVNRALATCFEGGFRTALLRGDTDFSQTEHLDGWNRDARIRFIFGYDSMPNMTKIADELPASAWRRLKRPLRIRPQAQRRRKPKKIKEQIVREREFENKKLRSEDVAEFPYRPILCRTTYRMVVVRKNISVEKGEKVLFDDERYFFYITNERKWSVPRIVFSANDRCHQENLLEQLKNGCRALQAPVDNLLSNWAYMVMVALAWNLKAWWALHLPEPSGGQRQQRRDEKLRVLNLEFKAFVNAFMLLPCQIVCSGRKLIFRLLSWNPHLPIFFRLLDVLRC
jgi:hypothetical protein